MPTYEYACLKCKKTFDLHQPMKDAALTICGCGKKGRVKRLLGSGAGIIFKGTGFHQTDYRKGTPPKPESTSTPDKTPKPDKPAKAVTT